MTGLTIFIDLFCHITPNLYINAYLISKQLMLYNQYYTLCNMHFYIGTHRRNSVKFQGVQNIIE